MHVALAGLYGGTIWLSAIAYAIIIEAHWGWVVVAGPIIISASIVGVMLIDWVLCKARGLWVARAGRSNARS